MSTIPNIKKKPDNQLKRLASWLDDRLRWVLLLPALAFIAVLLLIPLVYTINLSLTDAQGSVNQGVEYIGIANYIELLKDTERFWPAVWRTFKFTAIVLILELVFGMLIALLLRKKFFGQGLVRVLILLPVVATPVAVGMMWLLIFEPTIGFANTFVGWFGIDPQGWISDPNQAMATLIFVDVWQWTPMVVLILLAGMSTLPEETLEAAMVDGANSWQRFWHITVPLLKPTIAAAVLLRSIDALKTFDLLYATKGKGGGSNHEVETLNILAYSYSFDYTKYGLGSAVLMLFFVIILIAICLFLILRRKEGKKL